MNLAALLAAANLTLPLTMLRADQSAPVAKQPTVRPVDLVLGSHGELRGRVLRADGSAATAEPVILERNGQDVGRIRSDERGNFVFANVTGGICRVRTANNEQIVRAWKADSAPPAARSSLPLVTGQFIRGQDEWDHLELDETIIGGIAAAALTVGIIALVDSEDDDNAPGSP